MIPKRFFCVFLFLFFFVFIIVDDVNAGCQYFCTIHEDRCEGDWAQYMLVHSVSSCIIGQWEYEDSSNSDIDTGCEDEDTKCEPEKCPDYEGWDGKDCHVRRACGFSLFCSSRDRWNKKWSANTKECVECNVNNKKTGVYADNETIYLDCDENYKKIPSVCESGCGAHPACDEREAGSEVYAYWECLESGGESTTSNQQCWCDFDDCSLVYDGCDVDLGADSKCEGKKPGEQGGCPAGSVCDEECQCGQINVDLTEVEIVPPSLIAREDFTIKCHTTNGNDALDCVRAYADDDTDDCGSPTWDGSTAVFSCEGRDAGNYQAKCKVVEGTSSNCKAEEMTKNYEVIRDCCPGVSITAPDSVNQGEEFIVELTYTHDLIPEGGGKGGVHLHWLDDKVDYTSGEADSQEYKDGWEVVECSNSTEFGSACTLRLKALSDDFKLYYRAWDESMDAFCENNPAVDYDHDRDPDSESDIRKGTCSDKCDPEKFNDENYPLHTINCDAYEKEIHVIPTTIPCELLRVTIKPQCSSGFCCAGERIFVEAEISGDCPNTAYLQVDMADDGLGHDGSGCELFDCLPEDPIKEGCNGLCDIDGLSAVVEIIGGKYKGSFYLPSDTYAIPVPDCKGLTVIPIEAGLYEDNFVCEDGTFIDKTSDVSGSIKFGTDTDCGAITTSTSATSTTTTSTSSTTTTAICSLEKVYLYTNDCTGIDGTCCPGDKINLKADVNEPDNCPPEAYLQVDMSDTGCEISDCLPFRADKPECNEECDVDGLSFIVTFGESIRYRGSVNLTDILQDTYDSDCRGKNVKPVESRLYEDNFVCDGGDIQLSLTNSIIGSINLGTVDQCEVTTTSTSSTTTITTTTAIPECVGDNTYNCDLPEEECVNETNEKCCEWDADEDPPQCKAKNCEEVSVDNCEFCGCTLGPIPPEVELDCLKDKIYEGETNNCTVYNCNSGLWIVYDDKERSLALKDISPTSNKVSFTAIEEGTITTVVLCWDKATLTHETQVEKGLKLTCPDACLVYEDCTCEVEECTTGWLILENEEGNPLDEGKSKIITKTPYNYTFQANNTGKVKASLVCMAPIEGTKEKSIDIVTSLTTTVTTTTSMTTSSTTTTAVEKEFEMSLDECSEKEEECWIDVDENNIDEDVIIFVWLFEEPDGTIYYYGDKKLDEGETGKIKIYIDLTEEFEEDGCPRGTDLVVLALAYRESDDDYEDPLDRIKEDAFEC